MWSPADLAILVPMLGRPHRVDPLLESIHRTTGGARVLFLTSPEDVEVHDAVDHARHERLDVPWERCGDYARKINAGVQATTEPLLFFGADDLLFHHGWFEAAVEQLTDGVGVVGTNDLGNPRVMRGEHATHCLVTRTYIETHGTIDGDGALHEGYVHEYVDDELVGTAQKRGAWAFAKGAHVEHLHPHWGKAPTDESYEGQRDRLAESRTLYRKRRRMWT